MKQAIQYLAFGDSLTVGYGAAHGLGFAPQYAKALADKLGVEVLQSNAGVNGATTEQLLELLRTDSELREKVKESGLITITAGGNDLLQAALPYVYDGDETILWSALNRYEANYRLMLETIGDLQDDKAERCVTVLVGLFNPLPLMAEAAVWVRKFNESLRQLAGGDFQEVEVYDTFLGQERELLYSDHIHPNAKGYAVIAERIMQSVPLQCYTSIIG